MICFTRGDHLRLDRTRGRSSWKCGVCGSTSSRFGALVSDWLVNSSCRRTAHICHVVSMQTCIESCRHLAEIWEGHMNLSFCLVRLQFNLQPALSCQHWKFFVATVIVTLPKVIWLIISFLDSPGWCFGAIFIVPCIGHFIIPTGNLIFQRERGMAPTAYTYYIIIYIYDI